VWNSDRQKEDDDFWGKLERKPARSRSSSPPIHQPKKDDSFWGKVEQNSKIPRITMGPLRDDANKKKSRNIPADQFRPRPRSPSIEDEKIQPGNIVEILSDVLTEGITEILSDVLTEGLSEGITYLINATRKIKIVKPKPKPKPTRQPSQAFLEEESYENI
jgi:hypothetical protein